MSRVRVRRLQVEDWAALIFFTHLFSAADAFVSAHFGMAPQSRDANWANREEARMIHHIERERLFDVTREAAIEAVFRYPAPAPPKSPSSA